MNTLSKITDSELVANFRDLVIEEREALTLQLEYIVELDRRKLFFHYPSLRSFLVEEYGMEEWNAERKIRAARLLRRFPEVKEKLQSGKLNLTLLELVMGCAHRERLIDSEVSELLESVSGMSCRSAMREIASQYPLTSEIPKDRIRPISAELSEVRFVATNELLEKLDEIRGLLAHAHPEGLKMGELIDVLATEYRERHHPEEKAKRVKAREEKAENRVASVQVPFEQVPTAPRVRHEKPTSVQPRIPTPSIQHQLTNKDGYQCSYVDEVTGKHCLSQYKLEIDHVKPWSRGGKTELSNLRYLCSQHHKRISFLQFGENSKYFRSKQND